MSRVLDNFSRQGDWFKGYEYDKPVHIIGVGATGSFVALQLAKMGVRDLHVWDFDVIEEHNIANQVYGLNDIGKLKVDALAEMIKLQTGLEITTHDEKVTASHKHSLRGVVFVLTDSMSSRKDIFSALKFNPMISLVVETRMSIDCGRIYTINPMRAQEVLPYEKTFYDDSEAEVSFCGSSLSIVNSAMNIASYAVWSIVKDFKALPQTNELLIDYTTNMILSTNW